MRYFVIAYTDGKEGVQPTGVQTVAPGTAQAFTLTPVSGYKVAAAVDGSCAVGSWSGSTYTTGAITADCTLSFSGLPTDAYDVTPSGDGLETINPSGPEAVTTGARASFTVTASPWSALSPTVAGSCPGGMWVGNVFTTGPITADCTVSFSGMADAAQYQVTASGDGWENISPSSASVGFGDAPVFAVVGTSWYTVSQSVGGSCPVGTWYGSNYETGPIVGDCTVSFSGIPPPATCQVVSSGDGWETISPLGTQTVAFGGSETLEVSARTGYVLSGQVSGSCPPGSWSGSSYSTGPIRGDCSISFSASAKDNCGMDEGYCFPGATCTDTGPGTNVCTCPSPLTGDGTLDGTGCTRPVPDAGPDAGSCGGSMEGCCNGTDCNTGFSCEMQSCPPNVVGAAWSQVGPADAGGISDAGTDMSVCPSARSLHGMAYDSAAEQTVLFGGYAGGWLDDTWQWNGTAWTDVSPATGPPARVAHAMVYDSTRGVTVLFGGEDSTGNLLNDTWEWNGTTWSQVTANGQVGSPPARRSHAMSYDAVNGVTVLFGGYAGGFSNDTWEWNGVVWAQMTANGGSTAPLERCNHAMVYDSERGVSVLFGGYYYYGQLNDTWEWNGAWELATANGASTSPSQREVMAMAYDSNRGVTVLSGGFFWDINTNETGVPNDTWEWNGTTWALATPDGLEATLSGRYSSAMAYDAARQESVLFGGLSASGAPLDDTWLFSASAVFSSCEVGVCSLSVPGDGGTDAGPNDAGCPAGFATCGSNPQDICTTNLLSDPGNCGSCGFVCDWSGDSCWGGQCCVSEGDSCDLSQCCDGANYYCAGTEQVCTPYILAGGHCDPQSYMDHVGLCLPSLTCWSNGETSICE